LFKNWNDLKLRISKFTTLSNYFENATSTWEKVPFEEIPNGSISLTEEGKDLKKIPSAKITNKVINKDSDDSVSSARNDVIFYKLFFKIFITFIKESEEEYKIMYSNYQKLKDGGKLTEKEIDEIINYLESEAFKVIYKLVIYFL
jgi:hypothetical protein